MKALEILRDNFIAISTDTDTEMAMYYQDHIQIAIKELEELENRSCENCKHFEEINDKCNNGVMTNWKHEIDCPYDFSCNSWESK